MARDLYPMCARCTTRVCSPKVNLFPHDPCVKDYSRLCGIHFEFLKQVVGNKRNNAVSGLFETKRSPSLFLSIVSRPCSPGPSEKLPS